MNRVRFCSLWGHIGIMSWGEGGAMSPWCPSSAAYLISVFYEKKNVSLSVPAKTRVTAGWKQTTREKPLPHSN
jgi:hypothetical protein